MPDGKKKTIIKVSYKEDGEKVNLTVLTAKFFMPFFIERSIHQFLRETAVAECWADGWVQTKIVRRYYDSKLKKYYIVGRIIAPETNVVNIDYIFEAYQAKTWQTEKKQITCFFNRYML